MIVRMIPETKEERDRYSQKGVSEVEHRGVREFMIFGNKIDMEGNIEDFHEWHGSERYLMGSLNYFYETINDNRKRRNEPSQFHFAESPTGMIKTGTTATELTPIDTSNMVGEEGEFEEEEKKALELNDLKLTVEDLDAEADKVKDNDKGLKVIKD
jgi:hypothetical protein